MNTPEHQTRPPRKFPPEVGQQLSFEEAKQRYPDAMTRNVFTQGGFTFLMDVLRVNLETKKPVVLNMAKKYYSYTYSPTHTSFFDGLSSLGGERTIEQDGDGNDVDIDALGLDVTERYMVEQGLQELGYNKSGEKLASEKTENTSLWSRLGSRLRRSNG